MSRINWNQLNIKKQYRAELKPYYHDDVIAYDTETIDGKAVLITDSKDNHIFPENLHDCLTFLTRRKYRDVLGWFFNLKYDTEAMLKWCHIETIKEFKQTGELWVDGIYLKYIPGKMLKIINNKHNFIFFDIGNFLKGNLNGLAQKYLGEKKMKAPVEWSENLTIEDYKTPEMLEYCKRDSWLTEGLARSFMDSCNTFGLFCRNYCSPASLATHYYQSKIEIPTLSQLTKGRPYRAKLAYEAYKGGFICNFKKGYFHDVHVYDINSAYPYAMTQLPDLSKGRFIARLGDIPDKATMGWFRCTVETPDKNDYFYGEHYFNPLPVYLKKFNKNFYFAGKFNTTITLLEYNALKNYFKITPKDGIFWEPTENIDYLYKDVIHELYELKSQYKKGDKNIYALIKTLLNGFYGKTIQKIPTDEAKEFNTGNLFNPFHASYITAHCRIQAFELIQKYGPNKAIGVMTDGVAFDGPIDVPDSKVLGEWGHDIRGEGVFIGSGLYTIRSADKVKTATRGFKLTDKYDFFRLLAENSEGTKIELPQKVRLSYKEALRLKKFDKWNLIRDGLKKININCDNKRLWGREFENCGDVLDNVIDSQPFFVNM